MQTTQLQSLELDRQCRAGFISDLHIGAGEPAIQARFFRFLESARGSLDALFILGDLFEYWIGDDAAALCGHLETLEALSSFLADSDCQGYVMHGNRDFLLGQEFARQTHCELLADPCILHHGGVPILLSHGDRYCTDDTEHQWFRAQVRNPGWQADFLSRSKSERLDYARQARQRSESDKVRKSMEIMDVNPRAVVDAMRQHAVRHMIHGHTHRAAIHDLEIDAQPAYRIVLGDWFGDMNSLTIANGRIHYAPSLKPRIIALD
jgi:UDP-2,3-diacylglucosamine hydrolase